MPFDFQSLTRSFERLRRLRALLSSGVAGAGLILLVTVGCQSERTARSGAGSSPAAGTWALPLQGRWLRNFSESDRFERRGTVAITATNRHGDLIRLERVAGMDAEAARRMIEDGVLNLEALYANALSPYPGDISNRVVTEEAFHPHRALGPTEPWFILYANERFGFGPSTADQVKYKALLGWVHCGSAEELIKLRLYVSPRTSDDLLRSWVRRLSCQADPSTRPPSGAQRHASQP